MVEKGEYFYECYKRVNINVVILHSDVKRDKKNQQKKNKTV